MKGNWMAIDKKDAKDQPQPQTQQELEPQVEKEERKVVKYRGSSSIREITAEQWEQAGIKKQDTVIWNADNNWTVALDKLSEDALKVVGNEPGFEIVY